MHRACTCFTIMKEWAHLLTALALVALSISILIVTQTRESTKQLDISRFYTMKLQKGDTDRALNYLNEHDLWSDNKCQAMTNLSLDPHCLTVRTQIQRKILEHMKCLDHGSQTCSYLRIAFKALAWNSTNRRENNSDPTSPFLVLGSNLKGTAPNGETYRHILQNILREAPRLFHGAYKAEESNDTLILRSALYNLIMMAIFGNLIMHIADSFHMESNLLRFFIRSLTFLMVFVVSIVFMGLHSGSSMVLLLILFTSLITLVYFDMFLDPTIVRPWIHPAIFSTIYMSTCVLALVSNGILDYKVIVVHMLASMCAAQMFMSMAWWYVGYSEKMNLKGKYRLLYKVYITKETQLALLGSILVQGAIPLYQVLAPYNFTYISMSLSLAPIIFSFLSVASICIFQGMHLDDAYGEGVKQPEQRGYKLPDATAITGSKLYTSMLLLIYGAFMAMLFLWEHIETFRAYIDTMPEESIQYDPTMTRKYLMGQGLNLPATMI